MRLAKLALLLSFIVLGVRCAAGANTASGSSGGTTTTPTTTTTTTTSGDAQRAIAEADIIQLQGGLLYAMSRSGTVSLVDVSTPGVLTLLGQTTLQGQPFEMYLRGSYLVVMSNAAVATDGTYGTTQTVDEGAGAIVGVIDVHNPATPTLLTPLKVPGEIADSRIVGNVLYLASYENAACFGCGPAPSWLITRRTPPVSSSCQRLRIAPATTRCAPTTRRPVGSVMSRTSMIPSLAVPKLLGSMSACPPM